MEPSICAVTLYTDMKFQDRFEAILKCGIPNVELWGMEGLDIDGLEEDAQKSSWKLQLFCGNRDHGLIDPDSREGFLQEIRESMSIAKRLGCPRVSILSDAVDAEGIPIPTEHPLTHEEKLISCYEGLSRALELAESEQIHLVIEALNTKIDHPGYYLNGSALAFHLVRQLGSDRLRVLYDIYHMQIMEGDLITTMESNLEYIGFIHVADVPGRHEPGTGEINYRNILRMLSSNGYGGMVGLECFPSADSDGAIKAHLDLFKDL